MVFQSLNLTLSWPILCAEKHKIVLKTIFCILLPQNGQFWSNFGKTQAWSVKNFLGISASEAQPARPNFEKQMWTIAHLLITFFCALLIANDLN